MLPVEPVLNFRWPSDDKDLTETIKNAPPPDDLDALKDIIEEPVLDIIRTIGGKETYLWITQNRTEFSAKVNVEMLKEEGIVKLVRLARLRDFTVSFKHMTIPEKLKEQQVEEAAAPYKGEAIKIVKTKEGEGIANAEAAVRTAILDILTTEKYKEVAVKLEQMRALVAASQGSKATYVIPTDILTALGLALGGSPEKTLGMSQKQLKVFAAPIIKQVLEEQLKKQEGGR